MIDLRSLVKWVTAAALIGAFVMPTALATAEDTQPQVEPAEPVAPVAEPTAPVTEPVAESAAPMTEPTAPADEMVTTTRPGRQWWIEPRRTQIKRFAAARRFWRNPWAETRRQALRARSDAMRRDFQLRRTWNEGWTGPHLLRQDPWVNLEDTWMDQQFAWHQQRADQEMKWMEQVADWQHQQAENEMAWMEQVMDAQTGWMLSHQPLIPAYPYFGW